MVTVKRRSAPRALSTSQGSGSSATLPYGDGRDSPKPAIGSPSPPLRSPESLKQPPWRKPTSSQSTSLPAPVIKCAKVLLAIAWCVTLYWNFQVRASLKGLEFDHQIESLRHEEAAKTLKDARVSQKMLERQIQKMEKTKKALEHELRVASELKEGETLGTPHTSISNQIERRQGVLQDKVESLRAYIQEESRREVLEKFGPGPHRVKLTVKFTETDETKYITLLLAPLNLMPHSVHVFLELVSHKVWEGTVFWHHPGVTHLVSATAIRYDTGESRHHHLEKLRLGGVSFAEHSSEYPHQKYTVGFAGRGPDFYINTQDNSKSHGPGGQAHHELDDEADPCFAKVVEGQNVVDELLELSRAETVNKRAKYTWHDNMLTQIVKAEIL